MEQQTTEVKTQENGVDGTHTGVVPSGINYNECNNSEERGWCFNCYGLVLHSKSPHSYFNKEHGTRKGDHIHSGDSVWADGLSFVTNNVNICIAFWWDSTLQTPDTLQCS